MKVVRVRTEDFYGVMRQWWEAHNFPIVAIDVLPVHTFVCYNDKIPVYSCCFYNTDSDLAWIAWQISNPKVPFHMKAGGLELLFEEMEKYAKQLNYLMLFTTSHTPQVVDALQKQNFSLGDENVNHYVKLLKKKK